MGESSQASLSLQEWIDLEGISSSSAHVFLPYAVNIASMLADSLCQIARNWREWQASSAGPLPSIRLQDIQSENVILSFVEPPQHFQALGHPPSGHPTVKADFQSRKSGTDILLQSADDAIFLNSRQACSALGEILLEIFTRGRSRSSFSPGLKETGSSSASSASSGFPFSLELEQNSKDSKLPPASKRSATNEDDLGRPAASTRSLEAKKLLRDMELPVSICRLVSDLLDSNCSDILRPDSAFQSLEDVQSDLNQMIEHPELFLFDRTCPDKALEKLALFEQDNRKLYGRDEAIENLMNVARRVSPGDSSSCDTRLSEDNLSGRNSNLISSQSVESRCEAIFISGHSGSGKSSLIRHLVKTCDESEWFILNCKFDHQSASLMLVAKSFNDFFQHFADVNNASTQVDPLRRITLMKVRQSIIASIDSEGLSLLNKLIPNLSYVLSLTDPKQYLDNDGLQLSTSSSREPSLPPTSKQSFYSASVTSINKMGSRRHRLHYLFRLLVKSLCSSGNPVLMVLDDLQWADDLTVEVVGNFVEAGFVAPCQGGLLLLGSYRDNEIGGISTLANQIIQLERTMSRDNVTRISIGQLSIKDINEMLSFELCLPRRLTRRLTNLVHHKTRGNPLFVVEFLNSMIQSKLLDFSLKSRRWIWDEESINSKEISNGVAELLTSRLCQFSGYIIETLKIVSCFGSQVEESALMTLSLHFFSHDLMNSLDLAMNEGLIEKTGPIYAFSHDMIQKSIYELMHINQRMMLHKEIGTVLMEESDNSDKTALNFMAADQINICKSHVYLSLEERCEFVELNLSAGENAIALSSFEQAHSYIEAGLSLLEDDHWETQYDVSLRLHELSVVLSFMGGKVDTMSKRLTDILVNVKTAQDNLIANVLFIKYLAFSGRYAEAVKKCLENLSDLGENFPTEIQLSDVSSEISGIQLLLADITKERIQELPRMVNTTKLNTMKFMILLCRYSAGCRRMLLPLVASRIVKLTLQYGFCDESIVGLVKVGQAMINFAENIPLANRVGIIAESLIKESPNEHALRSMLSTTLYGYIRMFAEPAQTLQEKFLDSHNSGMLAGDVESAMFNKFCYVCCGYYTGMKLSILNQVFPSYLQEMAEHKQYRPFYMVMSIYHACAALSGCEISNDAVQDMITHDHDELCEIGKQTNDIFLIHESRMDKLSIKFWMRDFISVVTLAKESKSLNEIRVLDMVRVFYEGIAALCLARDTKQACWKSIGEKSIETISSLAKHSPWNFEDELFMLRAEMHYTNGDIDFAEFSYELAVASAREHHFLNREALALELYGIFLLENSMVAKALTKLHLAHKKYTEWGVAKKADAVKFLIDNTQPFITEETTWQ